MTTEQPLKFRIATPDDAPQIRRLVESAFRAEDSRANWTAEMALGQQFRVSIAEILATITQPDSANVLVSSVHVAKRNAGLARIAMLSVDQSQQRAGLGRHMLAHAEEFSQRTWGVGRTGLNALGTRDELIAWYMRCGYRRTGDTAPFPVERFPELDLPAGLCFVELEKDVWR